MASINRAKNYLTYLMAILISGAFALMGRPAPSWAEEVKIDRNAKVFEEVFRVAQADSGIDARTQVTNPGIDARTQVTNPGIDARTQVTNPGLDARTQVTNPAAFSGRSTVWSNAVTVIAPQTITQQVLEQLNAVYITTMHGLYDKLQNDPQSLTVEELALIRANANAIEIENIKQSLSGGGNAQ